MVEGLPEHAHLRPRSGPILLCIMDGVGLGDGSADDAVAQAHTPVLDKLLATCPSLQLRAHGVAVGLPSDKDMGNSEVGHNAMGAGRVFDQGAKLVDRAFGTGTAWQTQVWKGLVGGKTLHLIGLLSDGNVHSHVDHLYLLLARAVEEGVARLRLHVLTDGRDVPGRSALTWIEPLEAALAEHRAAGRDWRIASGGGRMRITMDRYEADWAMVENGWNCHVHGSGRSFPSASEAVRTFYAEDSEVNDQYLPAFVVEGSDGVIGDGDSVLLMNFRGDRALEISRAFEGPVPFDRGVVPDVYYAGLMQYDGDLKLPTNFLVDPPAIDRPVGEYMAASQRRTFACSETQKYGHVTFFFNGNRSGYIDEELETYVEIPSDNVSFDERPWMKAAEITDAVVEAIGSGSYQHIRLNYANGDMVGHTGSLNATRMAVEVVDICLARLVEAVEEADGVLLVTADHGNADQMWMRAKGGAVSKDADGVPVPRTSHSLNLVPFIVFDPRKSLTVREGDHGLAAIGTTILELCGLAAPDGYVTGLVR